MSVHKSEIDFALKQKQPVNIGQFTRTRIFEPFLNNLVSQGLQTWYVTKAPVTIPKLSDSTHTSLEKTETDDMAAPEAQVFIFW